VGQHRSGCPSRGAVESAPDHASPLPLRLTWRCSRHAAPGCGAGAELRRRRMRLNFGVRLRSLSDQGTLQMKPRAATLHNKLIDLACDHGWVRTGWKAAARTKLLEEPWREEAGVILDVIEATPCIPDAWRFRLEQEGEGAGWSYPVLVLELLEVEVTHPVDAQKLDFYERLWWNMDGTSFLHLRVFRMDRYGYVLPFLAEGYSQLLLVRHAEGREPIWYHDFFDRRTKQ
jgi:hypothetical protein